MSHFTFWMTSIYTEWWKHIHVPGRIWTRDLSVEEFRHWGFVSDWPERQRVTVPSKCEP